MYFLDTENCLRSTYNYLNDLKNRLNTIYNEFDQLLYDFTVQNPVTWNELKAQELRKQQQQQEQCNYPSLEQLYNKRQAALERYRVEYELAHDLSSLGLMNLRKMKQMVETELTI